MYSNKRAEHIRASKDLDNLLREIARENELDGKPKNEKIKTFRFW